MPEEANLVKVLLVDDRPDKLLALESVLADLGPRLLTARSGAEALRHLLRNDVAVILLDVNMPQMDGFETAALIRERPRTEQTPIIFLTAADDAEAYAARGYSLGAVDYIQMPVPPEVIRAKVAVFVDLYLKGERARAQQEREHEARLAEAAVRLDLETRRNRFFILAVDMLGIAGFDGYLRHLNPSWERILGFSERELTAEPLHHHVHPDDAEAIASHFKRLAEGGPTARFEIRHRHQNGSYRWLAFTAVPFPQEGLVYVFARDVTDRKRADEERLQLVREQVARRLAQRENAVKDEFLATLSHELRAPLTPILGWTTMLRSHRLGFEEIDHGLAVIERNVRHQAQLIEDLLDVSRIVSGKLHVAPRPMELAPIVGVALEAVRAQAHAKGLSIGVGLPREPVFVLGDPERLQQVVWNLASNAVKFTPKGGRIDVELKAAAGTARLCVRDSGVGIGPDFLPHVFERFRQAETGPARSHGGLGLGLTIVRHLVEAHGGTVRARSAGVGQGSEFEVTLACVEALDAEEPETSPPAEAAPAPRALEGLQLLVIDDDPEIQALLRLLLESEGAAPTVVGSVQEAFESLERVRPDAIVCDLGMPGTDGFSFIQALRARPPERGGDIPALALTAYASREDEERALAAGFAVHLTKPVDPHRIAREITSLVGRTPMTG